MITTWEVSRTLQTHILLVLLSRHLGLFHRHCCLQSYTLQTFDFCCIVAPCYSRYEAYQYWCDDDCALFSYVDCINMCWLCNIIRNGTLGSFLRNTIRRAKGEIPRFNLAEVRGLILSRAVHESNTAALHTTNRGKHFPLKDRDQSKFFHYFSKLYHASIPPILLYLPLFAYILTSLWTLLSYKCPVPLLCFCSVSWRRFHFRASH